MDLYRWRHLFIAVFVAVLYPLPVLYCTSFALQIWCHLCGTQHCNTEDHGSHLYPVCLWPHDGLAVAIAVHEERNASAIVSFHDCLDYSNVSLIPLLSTST